MAVQPKDAVSAQMQIYTLAGLPPHLLMLELQTLHEVVYKVYQPKQSQEICHLLILGVIHLAYILVQVTYYNGVSPW